MKSVLIALLLVAAVLLVSAEPRRGSKKPGGKGKPGGGPRPRPWQNRECPRHCSDCQEGTCLECDDDFALKTITNPKFKKFNKTICVPCGGRLKKRDPEVFRKQCIAAVTECPKNCSVCEEGTCLECDNDFALKTIARPRSNKTICVPCSRRPLKDPEVRQQCGLTDKCPRNCSVCQEGTCLECDDDFALKTIARPRFNKTICVPCSRRLKIKYPEVFREQCITGCPPNCSSCDDGSNSCETCDDGFFKVETRLLKRTICRPCGQRLKKKWPEVFKKECKETRRLAKKQRKAERKNMPDPF